MHAASSAEAARWIQERLHPLAQDVGSVVPEGFEAYARVLHPPYRITPDARAIPVRWLDIAAANGRSIEEELRLLGIASEPSRLSTSGETLWDQQPQRGCVPREMSERLVAILRSYTTTPERCWFAVWDGWGDLSDRAARGATFTIPERKLHLLHGAIDDVLETLSDVGWIHRSPNLWWPDDRAWCVATEIDFNWSYVGGTASCIAAVRCDPELEALSTSPDEGNAMER